MWIITNTMVRQGEGKGREGSKGRGGTGKRGMKEEIREKNWGGREERDG